MIMAAPATMAQMGISAHALISTPVSTAVWVKLQNVVVSLLQ